jgi:uncharacterized protein
MKKYLLTAELVILFVAVPLMFYFDWIPGHKSTTLLLAFVYCFLLLLFDKKFDRKNLGAKQFRSFKPLLIRFFFIAVLLTAYLLIFEPENLFIIPRENPLLWIAILVFYPLWSALPQELIFRVFFFHRYQQIIPNLHVLMLLNAFLFAFMHIIFNNWIALFGGFVTGFLWARTYLKTRSLLTVSAEHTIYGNFIYTIGLGHYFYVPDF